jgi:sulfur carrier protein ThiS
MAIEIKLIGFGDDHPARFNGKNRLQVEPETPVSVRALLKSVGIEDATGLIVMDTSTVIPPEQWDEPRFEDQTILTILSAFEGG